MSRMVNENLPSDTKKEEDEINRTVNEYRQQNPDFYNELHDGYFKSVRSFNKGIQIDKSGRLLESTGIKVPKVSVLMAELRLNQMLGGIINNDS
ncbi:MAG: hypothetical protein ACD_37C00100G0001 [uncultured bacterium]|nr:MAG: hypothetical protein ACD_37C00100G0001 [uncultured bacterium]